ncbi:MAG: HD-GYP domain-containing protein [Desulfobacterales bacterium]|jgi:putative nucleotidyltransferase with HDIG domain
MLRRTRLAPSNPPASSIGIVQAAFTCLQDQDPETALHCLRVAASVRRFCRDLDLSKNDAEAFCVAALFHDIGKTAVSERIIQKEGVLTGEEFEAVKLHSEKTREILGRIDWPEDFAQVPEIAASHHERWDGTGYPRGLVGDQIPLGSRVIAVADYFDALTFRRRYRKAISRRAAGRRLAQKRGTYFDPSLTDLFLRRFLGRDLPRATAPARANLDFGFTGARLTRTDTFGAPIHSSEDPRRFRGSGSRRCR